jgi:uronate dehydrogenase
MTTKADAPRRVLVTGSAGAVGRPVCRALLERGHTVRAFDRKPVPGLGEPLAGDLTDAQAVDRAVAGTDTVVHLAATVNEADFLKEIVPNNIVGAWHVFDAARRHGVKRLVVASTMQVIGRLPWKERTVRLEDGVAPWNHYAVSKLFVEDLGLMYALRHQITVIAVRIGWLARHAQEAEHAKEHPHSRTIFLSQRDAARFFVRTVEAEVPQGSFHIVFATSRSDTHQGLDLEPARKVLGYEPQDVYPDGLDFS